MNNKPFLFLLLSACLLPAVSAPIRGASAASSEEFPDIDLPYDAEVEWIEFDGGQLIFTDILPAVYSMQASIHIDYQLSDLVYCTSGSNSSYILFARNGYVLNDSSVAADYGRHVLDFFGYEPRGAFYDGAPISIGGYVASSDTPIDRCFKIGTFRNYADTVSAFKGKMYAFSMRWANGARLIDLIPVRFTNEEGLTEGAMYDRISGELFRNAGSGYFVIGPDKE